MAWSAGSGVYTNSFQHSNTAGPNDLDGRGDCAIMLQVMPGHDPNEPGPGANPIRVRIYRRGVDRRQKGECG